jgi:hemerythrin superfamily protein
MATSISDLMLLDHCRIEKLLLAYRYHFDHKSEGTQDSLKKLRWALEKHFVTEEKAIFTQLRGEESYKAVPKLLDDHKKILSLLKDLDTKEKITNFMNHIVAHKAFEDESFYPSLDKQLKEGKIHQIVMKVSNA